MSGLTLTATALAGMVLGCAVVGGVGQVAVVRARVDATADLAALAAAAQLARGDPEASACATATRVAAGQGAEAGPLRVLECLTAGPEVTVRVAATVAVPGVSAPVEGRARAGPVPPG